MTHELKDCFTFGAPPRLVLDPDHSGIDTVSKHFVASDCELFYSFGIWQGPVTDGGYRDFVTKSMIIDGHEATLSTWENPTRGPLAFCASAYVGKVLVEGGMRPFRQSLCMSVHSEDVETRTDLLRVFETIEFRPQLDSPAVPSQNEDGD